MSAYMKRVLTAFIVFFSFAYVATYFNMSPLQFAFWFVAVNFIHSVINGFIKAANQIKKQKQKQEPDYWRM